MVHNEQARRRQRMAEAESRDDMLTETVTHGRCRTVICARDAKDLLTLRAFAKLLHERKSSGDNHGRRGPGRDAARVIDPYEMSNA